MVPYRLKVIKEMVIKFDAFVLIVLDDIAVISFEIRYVNQKKMSIDLGLKKSQKSAKCAGPFFSRALLT